MQINGSNVLVTGGNGFLGRNLVSRLVKSKVSKIRVVDNLERDFNNTSFMNDGKIEFLEDDLCDLDACLKACNNIDIVFHCASKVGSINFYKNNGSKVLSHNILLDNQILSAAQDKGVSCFIYISSAFVYPIERMQDSLGLGIKEEEAIPANPAITYGWAKLMGEIAVQHAVENGGILNGIILRLSNFYGPYQSIDLDRGSIIPVLIRRALEYPRLSPFFINGQGNETRTYCYISDIIDAILLAVKTVGHKKIEQPLNIGSETPITIKNLAKKIIEISGKNIVLETLPAPEPLIMSQTLDCSKAKMRFDDWSCKVSLDDGLKKMFLYVSENIG